MSFTGRLWVVNPLYLQEIHVFFGFRDVSIIALLLTLAAFAATADLAAAEGSRQGPRSSP
jgi:hypothetical protein